MIKNFVKRMKDVLSKFISFKAVAVTALIGLSALFLLLSIAMLSQLHLRQFVLLFIAGIVALALGIGIGAHEEY